MSDSIRSAVLSVMSNKADTWEVGPDAVLRLSNVGRCLRQSWYIAHSSTDESLPRRTAEARVLWEMEDGNIHEPDIVARFVAAGYEIKYTGEDQRVVFVNLPDGYQVPGHPDGLVTAGPGIDEPALFEAKSMGAGRYYDIVSKAFGVKPGVRKAEVVDWDSPPDWLRGLRVGHKDYWYQVQGYLLADNLRKGVLAAKAKDSSGTIRTLATPVGRGVADAKLHVVTFEADPDTQQTVVDRLWTLRQSILSHSPPDGEYSLASGDWQCRLCAFVEICPNGAG
jgi:hypothetical protein